VDGVLSSANYAASFVLMQLLGFTLATKQPSMTAASIAGAIHGSKGQHDMDELVTTITRVCRSQLAAVIGNLGVVIPTAILFQALYANFTGHSFLTPQDAQGTIDSFHLWQSGTIFFAAFTGVLLWASSLGAGWLENWTVYRRLPEGIATHRWGRLLGRGTMRFFGKFLTKHVAGFGGNVTLGILLGMTPVLMTFFGLPIEVRHVTLSTGALTLSVCALGPEALTSASVLAAMGGIASMAVLNFGVSFVLALGVAFRAREVHVREAFRLFFRVIGRFFTKPTEFFFPPKVESSSARPALHH
jgi:site-specific recombinase